MMNSTMNSIVRDAEVTISGLNVSGSVGAMLFGETLSLESMDGCSVSATEARSSTNVCIAATLGVKTDHLE